VLESLAVDLGVEVDGVLASDNVVKSGALLPLSLGGHCKIGKGAVSNQALEINGV